MVLVYDVVVFFSQCVKLVILACDAQVYEHYLPKGRHSSSPFVLFQYFLSCYPSVQTLGSSKILHNIFSQKTESSTGMTLSTTQIAHKSQCSCSVVLASEMVNKIYAKKCLYW